MKICFPVVTDQGLKSRIHGRFSTTATFLLVDSESRQIENARQHDPARGPVRDFTGWQVDAVVVGNIGRPSLTELRRSGLKVFQARKPTVAENLEAMAQSELTELTEPEISENLEAGRRQGQGFGRGRAGGSGAGRGTGGGRGAGRRAGRSCCC